MITKRKKTASKKNLTKPRHPRKKPPVITEKATIEVQPVQPQTAAHVKKEKFLYSVGRRKSSIARVRLYPLRESAIEVNGQTLERYFPLQKFQKSVRMPLDIVGLKVTGSITIRVIGGGIRGQAEAAQLGIARAILQQSPESRTILKKAGLLRRDPREKERKKYGLRGARRAPQWQKR
ncbi:MAG TPA: 30S ribosomal protein S9 [Candidatus Kerfeldbacteria bacterium]|nr:MAG: 30S ribosomal protein S9 [Parcubacteria group bacterium GW2011_GWA2_48_9]KKW16323.1 MAG: 30S ribosomal protein S9 [Parcubacteria group bacterium GW2011_GWC2_49_9]HCJ52180.1 30S ribosomal protein S9 [Candidatus Kerfeldbacteria bacterium]HCM67890.1 30S ribosomal protein S9 [Candidatus Kerfeldbacteria bacterium]